MRYVACLLVLLGGCCRQPEIVYEKVTEYRDRPAPPAKEIIKYVDKIVEKPVDVIVEKPIRVEVIVEKPVDRIVDREVERPVYVPVVPQRGCDCNQLRPGQPTSVPVWLRRSPPKN
jgi:hypothetical protein